MINHGIGICYVISMHDEDYDRGEECLDYKNVVDLVIQNEYCISYIMGYM